MKLKYNQFLAIVDYLLLCMKNDHNIEYFDDMKRIYDKVINASSNQSQPLEKVLVKEIVSLLNKIENPNHLYPVKVHYSKVLLIKISDCYSNKL